MATLLILNQQPYDGTDVTWNALRLARQLSNDGQSVRIFLMNDSVDLAREGIIPPAGVEDMVAMTKQLIADGVPVKVCGTCQQRCGVLKGQGYYDGAQYSTMAECSEWVQTSDKVLTF
ncbi:MAG: sulfur reduction protein DsrE [Euryarchaeota archaeon]|nr:sulfur reduction protein DsrE [Euryarchaeota archaeon]DAC30595.1 MAG TPA: sulfur reduction protein DsrE [Candidatus Poseidoniales archaeon]HII44909.1 sulfur reduction protein DsrE [Candidatus Poseidoniaceae archaeon]|tara:strand:- start:774 stop:1127 length:354 start_codon:yes stop_codon:yes gene_type:complete